MVARFVFTKICRLNQFSKIVLHCFKYFISHYIQSLFVNIKKSPVAAVQFICLQLVVQTKTESKMSFD